MYDHTRFAGSREAPSVLVVDDDVDALAEVCEIVDALGLSVKGVDTVRSALVAVAEDKNIGLIITDLKMSVLDGFDLIAELDARYGAQRQIAKIVMSGFPSYDNAVASLRLGVLDFIEKPATFEKLKKAIRGAFQKASPMREADGATLETFRAAGPAADDPCEGGSGLDFIKELQKQRMRRAEIIKSSLFSDPAWDILLDLMAARLSNQTVSVSSACAAAQVPFSTGLRYVNRLVKADMATRYNDPNDRRRDLLRLSDHGFKLMEQYIKAVRSGKASAAASGSHLFLK